MSPWQFLKLAPVIVATAPLWMVRLNDVALQDAPVPNAGIANPKLAESILSPEVPIGDQLAADATDGTTNAHNANTTAKSNVLFFETIFNILEHSL